MRTITLFLFAALAVTSVDAAWYQTTVNSFVDPIQCVFGGDYHWSGNNLEPHAYLTSAYLTGAVLNDANFLEANLNGADLTGAQMRGADFSGADLSGSILTDTQYYTDVTWTETFYYTDNEPTWHSGMDAAWRASVGILTLAPTRAVSEPATLLLLPLLGLALLPRRRPRRCGQRSV